jgi:hypothetical protein
MKNFIIILLSVLLLQFYSGCSQSTDTCNKTTNYKKFESLLPKDFCMPDGYWVVDVFDADINNDERKDRLIKYYRKDWKCADTVFLAIYLSENNSALKYEKTLANLYTPMVREFTDLEWLVKNCADKYISQYAWDNQMWVRFEKGQIIVPFAIDLWNGLDFYFEYDPRRKNWYLSKQRKWFIPEGEYEIKYAPDSQIESVVNGKSIDDFKIKDYLQPW